MNHDFLNLLQEKTPGFSKGQRRIAQYIMEAYDKAAFMTANKLAQMVEWKTVEITSWSFIRSLATSIRWTEVRRFRTISCMVFCILGKPSKPR